MSQQGVLLDQDQFCCSVCLDILKELVTINCEHITVGAVLKAAAPIAHRPSLKGLLSESPHVLSGVSGDCCETHLQPHYDIPGLKKHNLVKATTHIQEKIFSRHDKLLDIYCPTDQQWVCYICTMDEHKGHDAVSAAAERTEKRCLLPPEPKTRERFLQYACQLTLDSNTTQRELSLSDGNRKVTSTLHAQPYPDHPDRFINTRMVLCWESLSGRCYWEVEWSGKWVFAAVSYKDSRTRSGNAFGQNDKS
ncbi:E3 ubiquitin-protein ligase TRIM34-like [Salvelinus alpinus]